MSSLQDLHQIEADFRARHQEYRRILSTLPLAAADSPDTDTVSSIVAEGTFFRYFTLWEKSIEKAFIHFCLGGVSLTGIQPVCKLANCDHETARKILVNGQRYLDWSDQRTVRERSMLFFENGVPFFNPISGKSHVLTDIEKIRNVIAHDSLESWNSYMAVQRNNFKTERNFHFPPGQMLRVRSHSAQTTWGENYFDQIEEIFTAVLRP